MENDKIINLIKNIIGLTIILFVVIYGFFNIHNDVEKTKKSFDESQVEERIDSGEPEVLEQKVDFNPWMRKIQKDIKNNWHPPKGSESKKVVVMFSVDKYGLLLHSEVTVSSGIIEVDEAALSAIKDTADFDPLPEGFKKQSIDIQFTFDYNVFSNK